MTTQEPTETSMILTPRQQHLQRVRDEMAPGALPAAIVPHTFAEVVTMCEALARADLAPKNLRGKVMDMAMVIMTGAEVGLPPMASLRLYTTWDGVPRLMAEGVRAIILQSPAIEYFEMATCDDNQATWIGKRRGRPEKSVTWTVERARKAGLLTKPVWQAYQQDMLNARASMQLGRILAPDVVAGMVALEEARDGDFIDAQSIEAKPVFVAPPAPQPHRVGETSHVMAHPEGPPPGVPDPAQRVTAAVAEVDRKLAQRGMVDAVTVMPTGTQPSGVPQQQGEPPRRGRPPRAQPSQTPGTDPFRAARATVDAKDAARAAEEAARPTTPASAPTPSPQPSASTSAPATGSTSQGSGADSSPTTDKWGQPVADPTSGGGGAAPQSSETSTSEPPSTASTESAPADDFGGSEDPEDSQPVPTGDPGLALIADLQTFLAGCKTQTEIQNGRPPFAQRARALCTAGDLRFDIARDGKPPGELGARLGQLWAERKAQLPV